MNGHDISEELRREHSRIATASVNGEIVGYGYGFMYMSPEEFVYEKYSTAVCRQSVRAAIEGYGITGTFYYFSGMGIVHRYRGLGISHLLAKEVDDYAQELNVPGVTRTLATSPIVTIRKKLGFEVIVASTLLHKDTENTNRVPMARKGT